MTSKELMDRFFARVPHDREIRLFARILLHDLADNWHALRLIDGQKLNDNSDSSLALRELAEAARVPESTEVHSSPVSRPAPKVTQRQEQPRWKSTCPRCFHVHEKDDCCGVDLGKGGCCDCKAEVRA